MPSIFISFSGHDNPVWRMKFRGELERLLRPEPDEVFYSEERPILAGSLPDTLKTTVRSSRFMISIIGSNYLTSKYCALELKEFFAVTENERADRKRNFLAIFLSRDTFNAVNSWPVWNDAGLKDVTKISFFFRPDGKTIKAVLEDQDQQGTAIVNPEFSGSVEALANYIKDMLPPRLTLAPSESPHTLLKQILIGPTTEPFSPTVQAAQAGLQATLQAHGFSVAAIALSDVEEDDPNDSTLAKRLSTCAVLILPVGDDMPLLPVLGAGGQVAHLQKRWHEAAKAKPASSPGFIVFWKPAGVEVNKHATGTHAEFLKGLQRIDCTPAKLVQVIQELLMPGPAHVDRYAKIVIESNASEYITPEPLSTRIDTIWKSIQEELPEARNVTLITQALSVNRMRQLKSQLGADAVILLWGSKNDDAVFAQVDNVDRDCGPKKKFKFIAYLAPPKPDHVEDDYLGWEVVPFKVVDEISPNTGTVRVVKEFEGYSERMRRLLRELAVSKGSGGGGA